MKNRIVKIILVPAMLALITLQACELIIDKDTTNNISIVSTKPVVTLLGEPVMEMTIGGTYVEQGIMAMAGDTVLDYTILEGVVDPQTADFYAVTYQASNGFGWATKAYRAVLVHDGEPYDVDITGNYKKGFAYKTSIEKAQINGYWMIKNVYQEIGTEVPIWFADKGDGTYGIVPDIHSTKGFYTGTAVRVGTKITFTIMFTSTDGEVIQKKFDWSK